MAPEVWTTDSYTVKADVFSFGIILWEIFHKKVPFEGTFAYLIEKSIVEGIRPPIADYVPPVFAEVIQQCWQVSPDKRPNFEDILGKLENFVPTDFVIPNSSTSSGSGQQQPGLLTGPGVKMNNSQNQGLTRANTTPAKKIAEQSSFSNNINNSNSNSGSNINLNATVYSKDQYPPQVKVIPPTMTVNLNQFPYTTIFQVFERVCVI
jgi:hypothetical protein